MPRPLSSSERGRLCLPFVPYVIAAPTANCAKVAEPHCSSARGTSPAETRRQGRKDGFLLRALQFAMTTFPDELGVYDPPSAIQALPTPPPPPATAGRRSSAPLP